ncbi:hypothetical protein SAMN05444395_102380 [Flavobacterium fryxellicola]|uniref:Uncharacterized protein n=1 Tax=Flavobacterium fryxellicola TaxID=249352 RepID=A0A167Y0J0_9FLAO|nr:hypothetical protein [Flavobacterium fryxellicola]OAB28893.1 hypothetical protein FBFR_05390 [Flavobacterium fryxellicola]SHN60419.1 hypothetical protein SAMN05444395_102380 [Flavobacterium fryxellicola]
MNLKYTFDELSLEKNKLILSSRKKRQKAILFSELDEIYISANKFPSLLELLPFLFLIIIATLCLLYLHLELMLFLPPLLIITFIVKMNDYKSYELKIRLKNGIFFKKKVPLKLKHETLDIINDVRKQIYNYRIDTCKQ